MDYASDENSFAVQLPVFGRFENQIHERYMKRLHLNIRLPEATWLEYCR